MAHSPVPAWLLLCLLLYVATGVLPQDLDVSPPLVTFDCSESTPQLIGTGSGSLRVKRQAAKLTMWPWMALLGKRASEDTTWYCAGMLINKQWVLTAAQCLRHVVIDVVRLGEYDYSDDADGAPHQDYEVAEAVPHPDYNPPEAYHDLALLRLNSTVNMQRFISPVCLPWGEESNVDIAGHKGWVLSFENDIHVSDSLNTFRKEIAMTLFSGTECDSKYASAGSPVQIFPRGMGEELVCAADLVDGRDASSGDSGGPLVTQDSNGRYVAAGIVAGGPLRGSKEIPGYYTNLRYPPHLAWIKRVAFSHR